MPCVAMKHKDVVDHVDHSLTINAYQTTYAHTITPLPNKSQC